MVKIVVVKNLKYFDCIIYLRNGQTGNYNASIYVGVTHPHNMATCKSGWNYYISKVHHKPSSLATNNLLLTECSDSKF